MEDADESVGELAQVGVVAAAAGSLPVVVGACSGRSQQRVERLVGEGVDEPVVVENRARATSFFPAARVIGLVPA